MRDLFEKYWWVLALGAGYLLWKAGTSTAEELTKLVVAVATKLGRPSAGLAAVEDSTGVRIVDSSSGDVIFTASSRAEAWQKVQTVS